MTAGSKPAGTCPPLDEPDYVQAWRTCIENRQNIQHVMVFDSSFVHHPPLNYSFKSPETRPTASAFSIPSIPVPARRPEQPVAEPKPEDSRDIPPLTDFLEDDEDEVARFRDYGREYNQWLIFLAVFAFINTVFIVRLTNVPTRYQQAILAQANDILAHVHMERLARGEVGIAYTPFVWPDEEVWVPALWYASLMLNVLNTLVVLLVKNWLMSCSVLLYRPTDADREEEEREREREQARLQAAPTDADGNIDVLANAERMADDVAAEHAALRRRFDSLRVRMLAYRAARRDALARTDLVRYPSFLLLFGAVAMFSAGALGKVYSLMFSGRYA